MVEKLKITLVCLVLTFIFSSCANRVQFPAGVPSTKIKKIEKIFYAYGSIGEASYELYNACGKHKVYEIYVYSTMPQAVYTIISFGIYNPRTVKITCAKARKRKQSDVLEDLLIKEKEKIEDQSTELPKNRRGLDEYEQYPTRQQPTKNELPFQDLNANPLFNER